MQRPVVVQQIVLGLVHSLAVRVAGCVAEETEAELKQTRDHCLLPEEGRTYPHAGFKRGQQSLDLAALNRVREENVHEARSGLLAKLFSDAQATTEACRTDDDTKLAAAAALLAQVAGQDLEVEQDGEGEPRVSIRRSVAPERIISVVDPEARHGHRSRQDRYDGYKVHLSVDLDSDLITAAEATLATAPDGAALPRLIDADQLGVEEVVADTAYGSGDIREDMARRGIDLIAPAPPAVAPGGRFTKADFTIDLTAGTVTCPAGHTVSRPRRAARRGPTRVKIRFPAEVCGACPLRASCTTSPRGRVVEIGPYEGLLQQARAERWTDAFRDRYRRRARVERKAAQVKFRSPKIPWRGLVKSVAWAKLKAAALNLDRMGR
ncbi:MAG: transposase, partial [Actinomycetota bacterium]|nr:transposase [Actinomycetota bacterium]